MGREGYTDGAQKIFRIVKLLFKITKWCILIHLSKSRLNTVRVNPKVNYELWVRMMG